MNIPSCVVAEIRFPGLPHPVQVRKATWADYHDILDIDASVGAYDAGDYLYGKLAIYLKDPDRLCYVGVYQGKVISYSMCTAVDRGLAITARLGRLDRKLRGKGVWEFVRSATVLPTYLEHPEVRCLRMCHSSFRDAKTYKDNFDILMIRNYVTFTVMGRGENLAPQALPPHIKMEPLSISCLYDLISDRKSAWRLFPHGYVIVGRESIKIDRENYHLITAECKQVLATHDVTSGEIFTLSLGTGSHSPQGYLYEVDIYTVTGNTSELVQHVLDHIQIAEKHMTGEETLKLTVFVSQKHGVGGLVEALQGPGYEGRFVMGRISNHYMGHLILHKEYMDRAYRLAGISKL